MKRRMLILTYLNVDFPNGFCPCLGHVSVLWTSHCYLQWSLLKVAISRGSVYLNDLGGGTMFRIYDFKRRVREVYWEEQK